jgi:hypothetical protein
VQNHSISSTLPQAVVDEVIVPHALRIESRGTAQRCGAQCKPLPSTDLSIAPAFIDNLDYV